MSMKNQENQEKWKKWKNINLVKIEKSQGKHSMSFKYITRKNSGILYEWCSLNKWHIAGLSCNINFEIIFRLYILQ